MNYGKLISAVLIMAFTMSCKSKQDLVKTDNSTPVDTRDRKQGREGRPGPPSVEEVFKMDTNQDGKLAKSELTGPLVEDFEKIDTDGDGFISMEELKNAPRKKRRQKPSRG